MTHARKSSLLLVAVAFLSCWLPAQSASPAAATAPGSPASAANYDDVLAYIHTTWDTLTRNMQDCSTIVDPKVPGKAVLYVPPEFEVPAAVAALQPKCNIKVQKLPVRITRLGETDLRQLGEIGLLYLPNPYVV